MAMEAAATTIPQYDAIRRRLKSQFGEQKQQQTDAIQRRFAAQGMLGAGAVGRAQDIASRQVAKDEAQATGDVDFQEAQESQRRKEISEGRSFQTSEREAAQGFNRGMFNEDLGFKREQAGEQKRQFQQEFEANKKANEVSAAANFIGDDIDDYDKVQRAKDWVSNMFNGTPAPQQPKAPISINPFLQTGLNFNLPWR